MDIIATSFLHHIDNHMSATPEMSSLHHIENHMSVILDIMTEQESSQPVTTLQKELYTAVDTNLLINTSDHIFNKESKN